MFLAINPVVSHPLLHVNVPRCMVWYEANHWRVWYVLKLGGRCNQSFSYPLPVTEAPIVRPLTVCNTRPMPIDVGWFWRFFSLPKKEKTSRDSAYALPFPNSTSLIWHHRLPVMLSVRIYIQPDPLHAEWIPCRWHWPTLLQFTGTWK